MWHTINEINLENYICSLEQAEESSEECYAVTEPYAPSSLKNTQEKSCCNGSETESCQSFQSGTMCEHSTANLGAEKSMSSAEGFPARTLVLETPKQSDLLDCVADYGANKRELLARYCPITHGLKTVQGLPFLEDAELLLILPKWGMTVNGELWEVVTAENLLSAKEYGYLPAIVASDGKHHGKEKWIANSRAKRKMLGKSPPTEKITYAYYEADIPMRYFPEISEEMMSWPHGWTDLRPLETDKMQVWLHSHGIL